jgi:hypothetical protein
MPFTVAPPTIEQTDFTPGVDEVSELGNQDAGVLLDVLNLLPDIGSTGSLVTRKGYERFIDDMDGSAMHIKNIHRYHRDGKPYLIVVLTNEEDATGNVAIYEIDLEAESSQKINPGGVNWDNPQAQHFGVSVLEVFYGGSPGNKIYSWNGSSFNDDAIEGNWKALKDDTNAGINTSNEYARDYAFTGKEHVTYGGDVFVPSRKIRYDLWKGDQHYGRGERVSHADSYGSSGSDKYYKSFRCIKEHGANTDSDEPGVGANWTTYWQKVELDLPRNDDDETSDDWYFNPTPAGSPVAAWFADRLWVRADQGLDKSQLFFSAPLSIDKGADLVETSFNVKDWAPGNDIRGPGGGWIPFNDGKHTGVIETIRPFNQGLLVFKRRNVWFLSGESEEEFSPRMISAGKGAVGNSSTCEINGLVYFLGDDNLYVTDGTTAEPVQGGERVAKELERRLDLISTRNLDSTHALNRLPQVWAYEHRVWISMPLTDKANGQVGATGANALYKPYVYDPRFSSWWVTDLPAISGKTIRVDGKPWMVFGPDPSHTGSRFLMRYDDPNSTSSGEDFDDDGSTGPRDPIEWTVRTSWWPFSVLRSQRRIRRVWALLRAKSQTVTLDAYADYNGPTGPVTTKSATVASQNVPTYFEGKWQPDCHALSLALSGESAPAAVTGLAVETQPRRMRYHTN